MAPKRKSGYDGGDDDGFVVADESSARTKKSKTSTKSPHFTPASSTTRPQKDNDGGVYWEISKLRRVTVSDYKGKKMISVREYYEKDGQSLPGKKGITMTIEQYNALIDLMPNIEAELKKGGIEEVSRPRYGAGNDRGDSVESEEQMEDEEDEPRGKQRRANHEATSDEEE